MNITSTIEIDAILFHGACSESKWLKRRKKDRKCFEECLPEGFALDPKIKSFMRHNRINFICERRAFDRAVVMDGGEILFTLQFAHRSLLIDKRTFWNVFLPCYLTVAPMPPSFTISLFITSSFGVSKELFCPFFLPSNESHEQRILSLLISRQREKLFRTHYSRSNNISKCQTLFLHPSFSSYHNINNYLSFSTNGILLSATASVCGMTKDAGAKGRKKLASVRSNLSPGPMRENEENRHIGEMWKGTFSIRHPKEKKNIVATAKASAFLSPSTQALSCMNRPLWLCIGSYCRRREARNERRKNRVNGRL